MRDVSNRVYLGASLVFVLACGTPGAPDAQRDLTPDAGSALVITPAKATWTWEEVTMPGGSGLRATLRNGSARALTSALGDGFNAEAEQTDLYLAASGGGAVERRDQTGAWQEASLAFLVEGTKPVLLRPGANYALTAFLQGTRRTGSYRIRIDYVASADGVRQSDYSATFEIR
ncbi:MAG: hypothetical protein ACREOG_23035 [Gemmatimonadaceae bacterium]